MKSILLFFLLGLPLTVFADPQAVTCHVYDAATGTKLNESAGKIVNGQCQVEVNTDAISSSSTQLLIEVTLDNGAKLKALEEEAAAKFLSGKKEVTSSVEATASGMVAYYQGLAAGGADCLSKASATVLPESCLENLKFKFLSEIVSNLKEDSSSSGQSVGAMAKMIRGFLNNGGAGGTKDPVEFLKRWNEGDQSAVNNAPEAARAGGVSASADVLQSDFLLMQKMGQIAATAFQEKSVQTKFASDTAYKQKYFDFLKSFESADQAAKVAAAGADTLKSFFKDGDSFKSVDAAAARELFLKEADANFIGFADAARTSALFKTLAATDYKGKSIEEIKNGVGFISGYVRHASDPAAVLQNREAIARFVERNSHKIDSDKLDGQYFETCRDSIERRPPPGEDPYEGFYQTPDIDVTSFSPAPQSTNLPGNIIGVRFNRDIDPATAIPENFLVHCLKGKIEGSTFYYPEAREVVFSPFVPFPGGHACYAKLNGIRAEGSTTITTLAWGWNMERDAFKVVSVYPQNGAVEVSPNSQIRVFFNTPVDASAIGAALTVEGCRYEGTFSLSSDGKELIYSPKTSFRKTGKHSDAGCQIRLSADLRDVFGRALGEIEPVSFSPAKTKDNAAPIFNRTVSMLAKNDSTTIGLSWSAAADDGNGPVFYDAYCSEGRGKQDYSKPSATVVNATRLDLYNLAPDRRYCCVVRARDLTDNRSSNSEERCATTLAPPPYAFFAYPGKSGEIRLTWSMVPEAMGYRLYIRRSGTSAWLILPQKPNPTYAIPGLHSGAYYDFKVAAVTANGQGGISTISFFRAP